MPVPASIEALDVTPASNSFAGSDAANTIDEAIRSAYAFTRQSLTAGSDIASASTITPVSTASSFNVTGTTTITAIGSASSWDGREVTLRFTGALTLTHSANLVLPGAANITTAAGDLAKFRQRSSGTWDCSSFVPALRVRFKARRTGSTQAAGTTVIYNTEDYDFASAYDSATGIFTAPVAGDYTFTAGVYYVNGTGATSEFVATILLNGATSIAEAFVGSVANGQSRGQTCSIDVALAASDTIRVNGSFGGGNGIGADQRSFFCGRLVRAIG